MPIDVNVNVEGAGWQRSLPEAEALARRAVKHALKAEGWSRRRVAVDVTLSDDAAVRRLNLAWRGKDSPTNVLSFPLESPDVPVPRERPRQLGDIILARKTLLREAKEQEKSLEHHFVHLVVHGTLHLLGYDHLNDEEAEEMENREIELLAALGLPNPY